MTSYSEIPSVHLLQIFLAATGSVGPGGAPGTSQNKQGSAKIAEIQLKGKCFRK